MKMKGLIDVIILKMDYITGQTKQQRQKEQIKLAKADLLKKTILLVVLSFVVSGVFYGIAIANL